MLRSNRSLNRPYTGRDRHLSRKRRDKVEALKAAILALSLIVVAAIISLIMVNFR